MPRFEKRFRIQLPVVTMPVSHGARPAIVLLSFAQASVKDPQMVYAHCIDIDGNFLQNVPLHISVIRAAALEPMTFIETDELIEAPKSNIIVPGHP